MSVRGVALSDLHLGYRAFSREINGRNARECDVENAWYAAVDAAIAYDPDLVTIAGDNFHRVTVSNHAIYAFRKGIRKLASETNAHIVIIPGNHEGARTAEALSPIMVVEGEDRVHVVDRPEMLRLSMVVTGEIVSVACVPFGVLHGAGNVVARPDPFSSVNVLLVHAAVRSSATPDALPQFYGGEEAYDIARDIDGWDVVACGDFHEFRRLHPTKLAFYSGSIERTSSNIWPETAPKGVVVYDTDTGFCELRQIPTRRVIDHSIADFSESYAPDAALVNQVLATINADVAVDDAIVRLVVPDFPRGERSSIDYGLVSALRERCFHFQLDLKMQAEAEIEAPVDTSGSIQEQAVYSFDSEPEEVRDCALSYLAAAAEAER